MNGSSETIPVPRRVVTGVNPSGKSIVVSDGPIPGNASEFEAGTGRGSDLWLVAGVPADLGCLSDPLVGYRLKSWPSSGEIIARIITWLPGFEFPMHRSDTIDVFFIISGQIELLLDEESVVLQPGDTAVQRGTRHGWRVLGNAPCTIAGVLIDAAR